MEKLWRTMAQRKGGCFSDSLAADPSSFQKAFSKGGELETGIDTYNRLTVFKIDH